MAYKSKWSTPTSTVHSESCAPTNYSSEIELETPSESTATRQVRRHLPDRALTVVDPGFLEGEIQLVENSQACMHAHLERFYDAMPTSVQTTPSLPRRFILSVHGGYYSTLAGELHLSSCT